MGMIRKLISAEVGRRLAGRDNGIKGALIGAAAPWLIRRAFTPAGVAIIGVIAAKKIYDAKKAPAQPNKSPAVTRSAPAAELR